MKQVAYTVSSKENLDVALGTEPRYSYQSFGI